MKTKKIEAKTKQERCRFCHRFMGRNHDESHCVVDGREDDKVKVVSAEECEKCEKFDSRFIEYPLTIQGIDNAEIDTTGLGHECGALCEISPCGKEYEGKSYIGFYLGELPIAITSSYHMETGILKNRTMNNPAIFVPELKKIIYGCESWWREIKSIEDFKGISKEDIENTWYVKLLKGMGGKRMINKRELEALEKYLQENTEDSPRIARSFLEDAIPVLKMRTARKVIDDKAFGKCPCCNYTFNSEMINEYDMKYCMNCGQELDFSE